MRLLLLSVLSTVVLLTGCSSTTYLSGPDVATPASGPPPAEWSHTGRDQGHLVIDVVGAKASVVEVGAQDSSHPACAATPCSQDVAPGVHRYRLVPPEESTLKLGANGSIQSKDGMYSAPVDVDVTMVEGSTHVVRVNLGQTAIRRSFPAGRGIAIAIMVAGAAVAIFGAAAAASATSGSPDQQTGQGWSGMGLGTLLIGAAVLSGNLRDDVTVTTHAGASVQSVW